MTTTWEITGDSYKRYLPLYDTSSLTVIILKSINITWNTAVLKQWSERKTKWKCILCFARYLWNRCFNWLITKPTSSVPFVAPAQNFVGGRWFVSKPNAPPLLIPPAICRLALLQQLWLYGDNDPHRAKRLPNEWFLIFPTKTTINTEQKKKKWKIYLILN